MSFLALCVTLHASASAQQPHAEGFVLGLAVEALRSSADGLTDASGGGISALIGTSIVRHVVVTFGAGVGASGAGALAHAGFAGRLYVPIRGSIRPFGEVGFMAHGREVSADRLVLGNGFSVGVGSELFWQQHRSVVVSLTRWSGRFDEVAYRSEHIDVPAHSLRLGLGVHLRPARTGIHPVPPRPAR